MTAQTTQVPKATDESALLREAAAKIEAALATLNTTQARCNCCRGKTFENYDHAKVFEMFSNSPEKLRQAANRLDNSAAAPPTNVHDC